MLKHLQKRIIDTVSQSDAAILSTRGSLGVHQFPCQLWRIYPDQTRVYLLVPKTLDMLENLTANHEAFVTTPLWQARGKARIITPEEEIVGSHMLDHSHSRWCSLVELQAHSIRLQPYANWQETATIDFD